MENNKNLEDYTCPLPSFKIIYNSETPCKLHYVFAVPSDYGIVCCNIDDAIKIVSESIEGKGCFMVIDKNHVTHYIMLDHLLHFDITVKEEEEKSNG